MHSWSNWKWKWQASSYTWGESGWATAKITNKPHLSHVGESKTIALARRLYNWPDMMNDLKQMVWACPECELDQISRQNETWNGYPFL